MKFRARLVMLTALATLLSIIPATVGMALDPPDAQVFISEIHYDNTGTDADEAIEVFGPADTDLSGWSLVLYNGAATSLAPYNTTDLSGTIPDEGAGYGVVTVAYPVNGVQNGSPDGVALVGPSGVAQFLSYEGSFVASGGPAEGLQSTDIGVAEQGDEVLGLSLQLTGSGVCSGDLTWTGPTANTFGLVGSIDPTPTGEPCGDDTGSGETPDVHINEIHYDNEGADVNEAVEVAGPAGTDLVGWTIALYNGSNGLVYGTIALTGILADQGGGLGTVSFTEAGIQNGAPDGLALVDPEGTVVEFLSYEGVFDAVDGPAVGSTSVDIGASEGGATPADQSLQRLDTGTWHGPVCASFGLPNDPAATAACVIEPPDPTATFIHDVQGSGAVTPIDGAQVIVEGIVTSDFQGTEFLRGFNLQEEDLDADADAATSEGVFIFDPANGAVDVSIGDKVQVTGTVGEFSDQTQITASEIVVVDDVGDDAVDPTVVTTLVLSFPVAEGFDFETIEGMLVTVPQDMYISEYFNYDRFGEMVIGAERYQQPTAQIEPDQAAVTAALAAIARGQIILDDGRSAQNPEFLRHPNGGEFGLGNLWRGGDILTDVTGVISPSFGWRIEPTAPATHTGVNPRTADHEPVGGRLEVASFNVLNYFTTLDDAAGPICGPLQNVDCRGANDAEELERQASKIVAAISAIDADVVGLIEIENQVDDEAIQDLVDRINDSVGAGTYDFVRHDDGGVKTVGTDAIRVGIIYKPVSVSPVGADAVLDDPSFLDPLSSGEDKNRAAQAQLFEENGTGEQFSVVVNHLKSKGSECGPGDPDTGNGAGNCNLTRVAAANVLADWVATDPYFAEDSDVLVIGDLNSYDKEDPIDALVAAGYTDLVAAYQGEDAYSYLFGAQLGYLDYAMGNDSLASQVSGVTVWHINSDEADVLDYNTDFKGPVQQAIWAPDPYRSSDHDPVIVGLELDQTPPTVEAGLQKLFSTHHFGIFTVDATCGDASTCVADINGVPVRDGQLVILLEARGRMSHETIHGTLYMKAPSFMLTVTGTDESGNTATATAEPEFRRGSPW